MKRFEAFAIREDQKYSGVFEALNEEEARQKVKAQGYEILSLKEVKSRRPIVAATVLIVPILLALIFWAVVSSRREPADQNTAPRGASRTHRKTPVDVLGKWVYLRGGNYLIAMSDQEFVRALKYKNDHDTKNLRQMLDRQEVGWTGKYGGGQSVYVHIWVDTEHAVEIKFKDTDAIAWVEEGAVL